MHVGCCSNHGRCSNPISSRERRKVGRSALLFCKLAYFPEGTAAFGVCMILGTSTDDVKKHYLAVLGNSAAEDY